MVMETPTMSIIARSLPALESSVPFICFYYRKLRASLSILAFCKLLVSSLMQGKL